MEGWVRRGRLWTRIFIILKRNRKADVIMILFLFEKNCTVLNGQTIKQQ